ncbi:HAD family hydrolase [Enterococcus sp. UD-01]|jgi:phosphoglycolate phosphatase|uniref:HAD family hydrolase n=1 Tax=Enterococcus sp. UD-01 TaxID=3373911 RepID=UPI0038350645
MLYKTILFDLDGTITDSGAGIINSVRYALEKMSLEVPDDNELASFIGPPLYESFQKNFQLNETASNQAIAYYREYYQEKGIYENYLYEGIPALLAELKQAQAQLYIATSKPEVFAKQILDYFDAAHYFTGIYGATLDSRRSKKGDVIRYALAQGVIQDLQRTVMIGDRRHDILGAKENNLASIGVLYGFGDRSELTLAKADYIVSAPAEIGQLILNK